jgi:2'-5' RNA ligase
MNPRYFIGITMPEELSNKIAQIQSILYDHSEVMQPLVPHITLLHPNVLTSLSPMYFVPKVKELSADFLPFNAKLLDLNIFHNQVFHITVESFELLKLQKEMVKLLPDSVRAQYYVGREFTPHVTLAQSKPKQDLDPELMKIIEDKTKNLLPQSFEVKNLTKFTWLSPRNYKVVAI